MITAEDINTMLPRRYIDANCIDYMIMNMIADRNVDTVLASSTEVYDSYNRPGDAESRFHGAGNMFRGKIYIFSRICVQNFSDFNIQIAVIQPFNFRLWILPMTFHNHWVLCIVDFINYKILFVDSLPSERNQREFLIRFQLLSELLTTFGQIIGIEHPQFTFSSPHVNIFKILFLLLIDFLMNILFFSHLAKRMAMIAVFTFYAPWRVF